MIHFYSSYTSPDADENRRMRMAARTWSIQKWTELPIKDQDLTRFFVEGPRKLPYIKDLFDLACARAESQLDIAVFTNSDLCVCFDCAEAIKEMLCLTDALYSYRIEFFHRFTKVIPDSDIPSGVVSKGTDIFAFRVLWWIRYRNDFPDLLIGRNFWDSCLIELINATCNPLLTELLWLTYHEVHAPACMQPENRWTMPSQRYVWKTALDWFYRRGVNPGLYGIPPM